MTDGGFAHTYGVQLLLQSRPILLKPSLIDAVRRYAPAAELIDPRSETSPVLIHHPDHPVTFADAQLPAQTAVLVADKAPAWPQLEAALQQSWRFPAAREVTQACHHAILVTDLMSSPLPYQERLAVFVSALRGVLEVVDCAAIHWLPAQQVIAPHDFATAAAADFDTLLCAGPINVRMHRITDTAGDLLMDTLGLAALGLPDLQCHFRALEPSDVARLLYNTALYVFQNGDVIDNGHTVEGLSAGSRWRCQHEVALLGPERVVLDLDPGPPFAAGNRR